MSESASYEAIPIVDAARRCGIVLDERTLHRDNVEAKCPFCGDKPGKYHLSLNTARDVFRCFYCGEAGNSVSLYARLQSPPISYGAAARALLAKDNLYPFPKNLQTQVQPEREPKPINARHEVFCSMLSHLVLSEKHKNDLMERGLSIERIERNEYRTLPESEAARRFLAGMLSAFNDLDGIPGFFRNNRGEWTLAGRPGILIPYRDGNDRIQGLQIRLDDESNPERKYRWFSGKGMKDGTKSGSWIHVTGNLNSNTAYITEGALKGDVASFLDSDALFVCVAGVNAIGGLRELIGSLKVSEVVIAWDMDKVTNWRVRNALDNIAKVISGMKGITFRADNWNASFKGIDDYYRVRAIARKKGVDMTVQSNGITEYLRELWKAEYPGQDVGFIYACEWEEKTVSLSRLKIDMPKDYINIEKARSYLEQIKAGAALPPIVCLNGFVIDGLHRYWAYVQADVENVRVYQNVPWRMDAAA